MDCVPGPTSSPLVQTLRWQFRPLAFLNDCRQQFGEVFSVKFVGGESSMVVVSHPEAVKAVYGVPENGMPHGRNVMLEPLLGPQSLLLLEGSEHLARRKLMSPAFHGEQMRSYQPVVEEIVTAEVDSWPIGAVFPICPRMQAVTLEVILRVIFGLDAGPRLDQVRDVLGKMLMQTAISSSAVQLVGIAARKGFRGRQPGRKLVGVVMATIDEQLYAEIGERRDEGGLEERNDILSALMLARLEDGQQMTDSELRDQLITLLFAGYETTATGLAWTFDLLLRHPAQLQRLRESLAAGEDDYLRATIVESLRLRTVIPLVGRRLAKELKVAGHTLPAGTDVTAAIVLTHTRADLYPEPFAFRPERFLEDGPETYAWIPFGGGVHRCLGAAFAEFEMGVMLREVLTRCELHKASPAPERVMRRNVVLTPQDGTPVVVTARRRFRHESVAA